VAYFLATLYIRLSHCWTVPKRQYTLIMSTFSRPYCFTVSVLWTRHLSYGESGNMQSTPPWVGAMNAAGDGVGHRREETASSA